MSEIRVAIVGVGNCANSLMQGLSHYGAVSSNELVGLVRPLVGPFAVSDIKVVAAFDVIDSKVGLNLSEAMWAYPNDTFKFAEVPSSVAMVQRGPTFDGLGIYVKGLVRESAQQPVDVQQVLRNQGVDVVINYLPVGSQIATEYYADCAIKAGCAFINCIPVFIASDPAWSARFAKNGLPIIGDDIKSQVGATIVHRILAQLFRDRGVKLDRTMQLNVGGNNDFLNMLERERLHSKKVSKTESVISINEVPDPNNNVHIGPSDYVRWLSDRKWAYMRLEGRGFGGAPLNIELKLEVWDSPNSAGIVIDAIRCAQLARTRGEGGVLHAPSAYFMKRPPVQRDDNVALDDLEKWLTL